MQRIGVPDMDRNQNDYRSYAGIEQGQGYGQEAVVANAAPVDRAAFLRKVYGTLTTGIGVSMVTGLFFAVAALQNPSHLIWKMMQGKGMWVLFLAYLALSFMVGAVVRKKGVNILAYLFFTAFTGFFISPMLAIAALKTQSLTIIWQALGITVFTFGALTGYVLISGKDFSFMKGFIWTGFWVLIGFTVVGFWVDSWAYQMAIMAAGLLVFAGFILYDTSKIMLYLGPDEWVAGAFSLFIDFINMFIRVLYLLLGRRN